MSIKNKSVHLITEVDCVSYRSYKDGTGMTHFYTNMITPSSMRRLRYLMQLGALALLSSSVWADGSFSNEYYYRSISHQSNYPANLLSAWNSISFLKNKLEIKRKILKIYEGL